MVAPLLNVHNNNTISLNIKLKQVKAMRLLSQDDISYYRSELVQLLKGCIANEWNYTHHFHYLDISSFRGSDTRPFLRRVLRTLEHLGYLKHQNTGMNIHQWMITDKGIDYAASK